MTIRRKAWAFAIIYLALSLGFEASLILLAGLRVPEDNATIAPLILTVPPILAVLLAGYRKPKEFVVLVVLTVVLTVAITLTVNKLTGISTGLLEPIINRSIAGFLAATITNRILNRGSRNIGREERKTMINTDCFQLQSSSFCVYRILLGPTRSKVPLPRRPIYPFLNPNA